MMNETQIETSPSEIAPEDRARADMYALIASLFYSPPTPALLRAIADAPPLSSEAGATEFSEAWRQLQSAAAKADPEAVRDEYEWFFIAVGPSRINQYAAHYMTGPDGKSTLVRLREDLLRLGFSKNDSAGEPEDHISALCDAMRLMIAGAPGGHPCEVLVQKDFFNRHLKPWYARMIAELTQSEKAHFYLVAARFAKAFFDVEIESFNIE